MKISHVATIFGLRARHLVRAKYVAYTIFGGNAASCLNIKFSIGYQSLVQEYLRQLP